MNQILSKYAFGILILVAFNINIQAQTINAPDTAFLGSPVTFNVNSPNEKFITYAWEFGSTSFQPIVANAIPINNTGISGHQFALAAAAVMVYDKKNKSYHGFVSCASNGFNNPNVQRIDFGVNPNNPNPAIVNLGNPGNSFINNNTGYNNMEDIKIVMDDEGIFHAFINNGGVVHWVFGNGLQNLPTLTERIFTDQSVLSMSMNLAIVKFDNNWYIFTGQNLGVNPGLVRLDLGSDLSTISSPSYVIYPTAGGFSNLTHLAMIKEAGKYYINMSPHTTNAPLIKYSFGTNLLNPSPVVENLGFFTPAIVTNRGLNFVKTCDTLYMLGMNNNGSFLSFTYANNDISNLPTTNTLGQLLETGVAAQTMSPYWYNDTLWILTASYGNSPNHNVFRMPIAAVSNTNTFIEYYSSTASHEFTTPGVYDISVYCDQGDNRGPQALCKQIVIVEPTSVKSKNSSSVQLNAYPNPTSDGFSIQLPESGTYAYVFANILGQKIYASPSERVTNTNTISIDAKKLGIAAGLVFVTIQDNNGKIYTSKVVLQ